MSVEVLSAVFNESQSTGAQRLVLLALANSASHDGQVIAYRRSHNYLMSATKLSERSLTRAVAELVTLGELVVVKPGKGHNPANYRILLPSIVGSQIVYPESEGSHDDHPGVPESPPRVDTMATQGRQDVTSINTSLSVLSRRENELIQNGSQLADVVAGRIALHHPTRPKPKIRHADKRFGQTLLDEILSAPDPKGALADFVPCLDWALSSSPFWSSRITGVRSLNEWGRVHADWKASQIVKAKKLPPGVSPDGGVAKAKAAKRAS